MFGFGVSNERRELASKTAQYQIEQCLTLGFQKGTFPLHFEKLPDNEERTISERMKAMNIECIEFSTTGTYNGFNVVITSQHTQNCTNYSISY
jgi:hypothetical protein